MCLVRAQARYQGVYMGIYTKRLPDWVLGNL